MAVICGISLAAGWTWDEAAWVPKIEIGGLRAGTSEVRVETMTT